MERSMIQVGFDLGLYKYLAENASDGNTMTTEQIAEHAGAEVKLMSM